MAQDVKQPRGTRVAWALNEGIQLTSFTAATGFCFAYFLPLMQAGSGKDVALRVTATLAVVSCLVLVAIAVCAFIAGCATRHLLNSPLKQEHKQSGSCADD